MSFHILTDQELEELTGYATPAKQREVLRKNGIYFVEGKNGRIRTTSENIRWPMSTLNMTHQRSDDGFNLEAI
jgi:hypothetical protein